MNIKNVEQLMKDKVIDMSRLKEYCLKCQISNQLRFKIWKVLIGVLPTARKAWRYVMQQYYEQFEDIYSAMIVIEPDLFVRVDNDSDTSTGSSTSSTSSAVFNTAEKNEQLFVLYKLHKLMFNEIREKNPVKSEHESLLSAQEEKYHLLQIIKVISTACEIQKSKQSHSNSSNTVDNYEMRLMSETYWSFSMFMEKYFGMNPANWRDSVYWMSGELMKLIEVADRKFYSLMLQNQKEFEKVFAGWFTSMFSSFLSIQKTMRLWDCLLLFQVEFVLNVALSYVRKISSKLLSGDSEITDPAQILFHLIQIEEHDLEAIIQTALDMTKK